MFRHHIPSSPPSSPVRSPRKGRGGEGRGGEGRGGEEGGREGEREGEREGGGGGMNVIHILIGMFNSNPIIPQCLNNNLT